MVQYGRKSSKIQKNEIFAPPVWEAKANIIALDGINTIVVAMYNHLDSEIVQLEGCGALYSLAANNPKNKAC